MRSRITWVLFWHRSENLSASQHPAWNSENLWLDPVQRILVLPGLNYAKLAPCQSGDALPSWSLQQLRVVATTDYSGLRDRPPFGSFPQSWTHCPHNHGLQEVLVSPVCLGWFTFSTLLGISSSESGHLLRMGSTARMSLSFSTSPCLPSWLQDVLGRC